MKAEQKLHLGLSAEDATTLVRTSQEVLKTGVTAAVLLNASPGAAIGVTLAAAMTGVILERRQARMVDFMQLVSQKTQALPSGPRETFTRRFDSSEGQQFFETAWERAARTADPAKLDAIASLVKNSMSGEELEMHQAQWLLQLLDELDAVEIILLQARTQKYHDDEAFFEQHKLIFENSKEPNKETHPHRYDSYFLSGNLSDEQQKVWEELNEKYQIAREKHSLYVSRINHLVDVGLLGKSQHLLYHKLELTALGAALLKIIDLADDKEWGQAEQLNVAEVMREANEQSESLRRSMNDSTEKHKQQRQADQKDAQEFLKELERGLRNR